MPSWSTSAPSAPSSAGRSRPITTSRPAPSRPTSRAIARAVAGWSPVTMATRIPACRHAARASAAPWRGGSSSATSPRSVEVPFGLARPTRRHVRDRHDRLATASTRSPRLASACSASARTASSAHQREDRVGRALHQDLVAGDHRHAAPPRVEREPARLGSGRARRAPVDADPPGERVERSLHRVAARDPSTVVLDDAPGRAAGRSAGHLPQRCLARQGRHATVGIGLVARPRRSARTGRHPHLDDRHLVAGQRSRLVRADERGRPERLDRLEMADERVARRHALRADRQRQGHGRQQPFGDDGDGDADREQESVRRRACRPGVRSRRTLTPTPTATTAMMPRDAVELDVQRGRRRPCARVSRAMPASRVRAPVATTVASPRPRRRSTRRTRCRRRPDGAGTLSPVSVDVSTARACTASRRDRPRCGRPPSSRTTSPTTSSSAAISTALPVADDRDLPRAADRAAVRRRARRAAPARTRTTPLSTMTTKTATPSWGSPARNASAPATQNSSAKKCTISAARRRQAGIRGGTGKTLAPSTASLVAASSLDAQPPLAHVRTGGTHRHRRLRGTPSGAPASGHIVALFRSLSIRGPRHRADVRGGCRS